MKAAALSTVKCKAALSIKKKKKRQNAQIDKVDMVRAQLKGS